MPRACGASSTPRLFGSITAVSGILDRPLSRAMTVLRLTSVGALILDPVAMQIVAVGIEPALGALDVIADAADHAPEPRRVVHLDEVRHFMRGEIIQHKGRRENQ